MRAHSHADTQLLVYFPNERIVEVADVYMPEDLRTIVPGQPLGWGPWNRNVLANINFRKLQVDRMAPIHGAVVPYSTFLEHALLATTHLPKELQQPATR